MQLSGAKIAPQPPSPAKQISQQPDFNPSELSFHASAIKKSQVSQSLRKSIRNKTRTQPARPQTQAQAQQESQLTQLLRTKIKELRRISICEICSAQFRRSQAGLSDCQHRDTFCQTCLYLYAIYKIRQFQEVYCPAQNCGQTMATQGSFFKQIPQNLQNTYHKIHRFTVAAKDPQVVKLCPSQNCQGFLSLHNKEGLLCSSCLKQYCTKCHLQRHENECDQNELSYLQNNLHYRQCSRCKMVVQKTKGCDHMTCKCGYEFCYICGERWTAGHAKMHQPTHPHAQQHYRAHNPSLLVEMMECCICQGCSQGVCRIFWSSYVGTTLKIMLKLLLLLAQVLLVLLQAVFKDIPFLLWLVMCTLVIGLFFSSFQVICERGWLQALLLVLLFPVAMVLGVARSCSQVFVPAMHEFFNGSIEPIIDEFGDIIRF